MRGTTTVGPEDIRVSERVVVHGKHRGEELTAVRVSVAPPLRNCPSSPRPPLPS